MVFLRTYTLVALLLMLATAAAAQPAAGEFPTVQGTRRALIVGISEYSEPSLKLNYAASDAALFREYLLKIEKLQAEDITYLTSNDPSAETYAGALGVYNALDQLLETTQPEDLVYIYFAGHGDVVKKITRYEGYLLAADANASQNYKGTGGVVALQDLNEYVGALTASGAKVVLVLDACHSGFAYKEGAQRNMESLNESFFNTTRYLSCKPDQFSYESGTLGHGYFTYYLVLGLMGAADVDDTNLQYKELGEFLYTNVYNESEEKQTPLVVTQNQREVLKAIDPQEKKASMEIVKKSSSIKDLLASRSSSGSGQTTTGSANDNPIIKAFNDALAAEAYYEGDNSALALYNNAKQTQQLPEKSLKKMQFALLKALSSTAQMLINYYIEGHEKLPGGQVFVRQAQHLDVCLSLMPADAPMRERLVTSKLFLEAYSIIRTKNYSNYPQAKEKLLKALELEPRAAYIHNALGVLYGQENSFDKAHIHYEKAKELIPNWAYPINNLGTNYFDQYQYKKAKYWYEEALARAPEYHTALQNLGALYKSQGKYQAAEQYYLRSADTSGALQAITLRNLGGLYEDRGNIKKALAYYKRALEQDPKDVDNYYNYSDLLIDEAIDIAQGEALLQEAIAIEPYFSKGHATYADLLRRYPKSEASYTQALELYDFAIANDPFYEWAYAGRGWLYSRQEQPDKALASFKAGIAANPEKPRAYYYLAQYYKSALTDFENAEKQYRNAIAKDSFYLPAYKGLVDLYNKNDKQEQSLALLHNLVRIDDEAPDSYNLLGNTYYSQGNNEEAINAYQRSLDVDSTYAKGFANLAYSLLQSKRYKAAVAAYRKAIDYNPYKNNVENFTLLLVTEGRRLKREGNLKAAETSFKEALHLDANYTSATALAEHYYFADRPQEALEVLQLLEAEQLSKTRKTKYYELSTKLAIDLEEVTLATASYNALTRLSPRPDKILGALTQALEGKTQEAKTTLTSLSPMYFNEQLLETKYSPATIQRIKKLKP